jgi:hypothetical protein
MSTVKRLGLLAVGYGLAALGGLAAVAVNEMRISLDVQQTSGGMVAFGDVVLFLLVTGFLGLVPSWFLLKALLERAPAAVLAAELLLAAIGPPCWLAVIFIATGPKAGGALPAFEQMLGPLVAFGAIPRMVFGPALLALEAATFVLVRRPLARGLLAAAMLMDVVPLGLFAAHMALATHG